MMIINDPFQNIPKFDPNDTTDFKDWWGQEFLPIVKQLRLSEKDASQRLRSCLNKTACKGYDSMVRQSGHGNIKTLLKMMQNKFQTVEKASLSLLYSRRLRRGETVLDYAVTLEELHHKVDPDCDPKKHDRVLAEVFRKGLPFGLLRIANITYPYPKRLNELLKRVRHYEKEWLRSSTERTDRNRSDHGAVRTVQTTGRPGDRKEELSGPFSNYGGRGLNTGTYADVVTRYRNADNQISCFRCGKPGHYANVCNTEPQQGFVTERERQYRGSYSVPSSCGRCGEPGHTMGSCPYASSSRSFGNIGTTATKAVSSEASAPRMASSLNTGAAPFVVGSSASARLVKVQMLNQVTTESSALYKAPSISLQVRVNGIMVAGLCDMGAGVSLISDELYDSLGRPRLVTTNANVPAKMVDETVIRLRKLTELDLDFGGYIAHKQRFFVVPSLHCPGILLGMNVIRYAQIRPIADRFNPEKDRVYVGPKGIRATLSFSEVGRTAIPLIARIAVTNTTQIPARSVASVPVKASGNLPGDTGLLSFNKSLERQLLDGCEFLVSLEDNSLTVPVFDSTDPTISLRSDCYIGEVMPMELQDIIGPEMHSEVSGLEEDGPKIQTVSEEPVTVDNLSCRIKWNQSDLSETEKGRVVPLLQRHTHTISTGDADLGRCPFVEHRIEAEGPPIKLRNRQVTVNFKVGCTRPGFSVTSVRSVITNSV